MLRFIKQCFFTGLTFSSTLKSINMLCSISMNNQECKVRPQMVNVNGDDHVIPFTVKTSRFSGSCNNSNIHIVKNLNVTVFNLVLGTNETRCKE